MADTYAAEPAADKPKADTKTPKDGDEGEICRTALRRYQIWTERERDNTDQAYEDLDFRAGNQWPSNVQQERENEKRPVLTINRIPQFVRQVTGDMRQMRPSIKVVPVDNRGDKDTAETIAGMVRYVENRSDASAAYMSGADSQVVAGIGHWRVTKEYAAESTFNQELRIMGVDDGIAVAWDPDSVLPTREDAKWCIVPVDMSHESFKEQYPDAPLEDFDDSDAGASTGWYDKDFVRVAEYWVKKPIKRTLALYKDGAIVDLTDGDKGKLRKAKAGKARIEQRDGFKVCRYLITAAHVLDGPIEWPGLYIPIVPVIGEEIRIGRKVIRHGLVRFAKDPQRMYNFLRSAETEVVALQPKAGFTGTEKNFEKYQEIWSTANTKNWAYYPYTPDPVNGGAAPQRVQPPVSSQGIADGIAMAVEDMKATFGIYDASLGKQSNETSGKAIMARQREGDVGSFVYVDNWARAIKHTGKILIDLIPHVYDTERMIRIMGEDGKVDLKWINRPVGMNETDPATGELKQAGTVENDVTVGAYDVVLDTGPSYTTKREEAKEGMIAFLQAAGEGVAPVVMDLVAKAQDWPLADEFAKRLEVVAPAPVQELIANQKKEQGEELPPPKPPSPGEQMQMAAAQEQLRALQLDNSKKEMEIATAQQALQVGAAGEAPDPLIPIKAEGEQIGNVMSAEKGKREIALLDLEIEEKRLKIALLQTDLAGKQMGIEHKDAEHQLKMAHGATGLAHEQEDHQIGTAERMQGMAQAEAGAAREDESHAVSMEQGAQSHKAKLKAMQRKPEPRTQA